jgi:superfamily I DNA and/or RNA helicase/very-short-patch-repair endonuclease
LSTINQFRIFLKGEDKTDAVEDYKYLGEKCKVIFKSGKSYKYNSSNVQIIDSALKEQESKDCFEYLKELAEATGLEFTGEDGEVFNILTNNYSKINFVDPDSLFAAFLSGKFPENTQLKNSDEVIYPFGFNSSQKDAVDRALTNSLSIIEGPPGTGKTQTILNIISNVVSQGKSVAVVSSNNSATQNVFDKLEKNGLDFIVASLGNRENKKAFIESQCNLPDMNDWKLSVEDSSQLKEELRTKQGELSEKLSQKVKLSGLKQELSKVRTEKNHFEKYYKNKELDEDLLKGVSTSSDALDAWMQSENFKRENWIVVFIKYVFEILTKGRSKRFFVYKKIQQYPREVLIGVFQYQFYNLKIKELSKSIEEISSSLERYNYNEEMFEYANNSMTLFKSILAERYNSGERNEYELEDLKKNSDNFLEDYPVILSTTYSSRSSLSNDVIYDYLIMDEASQVDICTGSLALSCAKNVVIVGDIKQLPPVIDDKDEAKTNEIFAKYQLSESYRYSKHSLLSSLVSLFPEVSRTLLREHYRCHPKIIDFCNKKFYDDRLIIMTEENNEREPLVVYKTVEGNHARELVNQRQIDVIKEEVISELKLSIDDDSVGITTPYRAQTNKLQKTFKETSIQADTVNKFQGQEKSIIILSTVDNQITKFADDKQRLNVAVSRAVDQLIVVINKDSTLEDTNIGDLISYIEYNNLSIINSKVHSVFDYLYSCYEAHRKKYLSKTKKVSDYDSENLMYTLIVDVLKEEKFKKFRVVNHKALKEIVRDTSLLTPEEERYVSSGYSHVDFLIYDIFGKEPKLAIEVDGVSFHQEGSKQADRDELKNQILLKYELPLIRFGTDGSNERQRLIKGLEAITSRIGQ